MGGAVATGDLAVRHAAFAPAGAPTETGAAPSDVGAAAAANGRCGGDGRSRGSTRCIRACRRSYMNHRGFGPPVERRQPRMGGEGTTGDLAVRHAAFAPAGAPTETGAASGPCRSGGSREWAWGGDGRSRGSTRCIRACRRSYMNRHDLRAPVGAAAAANGRWGGDGRCRGSTRGIRACRRSCMNRRGVRGGSVGVSRAPGRRGKSAPRRRWRSPPRRSATGDPPAARARSSRPRRDCPG